MAVTATQVRLRGGINGAEDHLMWNLANSAALDTMITDLIAEAVAYHTYRIGDDYTQVADTNLTVLMNQLDIYWVLMEAFEALKAQKTAGVHAPYDSEETASYNLLIAQEWKQKYDALAADFVTTEATDSYSAGVFVVSTAVDPDDVDCITDRNRDILDRANGAWCPT